MTLSKRAVFVILFAAMNGLCAVMLAAWAAHGLESVAPTGAQGVRWFEQGSQFQMWHALALILTALVYDRVPAGRPKLLITGASIGFALGILFFSGSLYAVTFEGTAMFAPVGGLSSMIGWALFGLGAISAGAKRVEAETKLPHPTPAE